MSELTNNRFRFSDRITLITENGHNVIVNQKAVAQEAEQAKQIDIEEEKKKAQAKGWAECEIRKNQEIKALQLKMRQESAQLAQTMDAWTTELEGQVREETLDLAFRIAEHLLERELSDRDACRAMLKRILQETASVRNVKLYVNPETAAAIAAEGIELRQGTEVLPDPTLKPGEAKISGSRGIVDGTFAARLGMLREELVKNMPSDDETKE